MKKLEKFFATLLCLITISLCVVSCTADDNMITNEDEQTSIEENNDVQAVGKDEVKEEDI